MAAMAEIHAKHIDPGLGQSQCHIGRAAGGAQSCNDPCTAITDHGFEYPAALRALASMVLKSRAAISSGVAIQVPPTATTLGKAR